MNKISMVFVHCRYGSSNKSDSNLTTSIAKDSWDVWSPLLWCHQGSPRLFLVPRHWNFLQVTCWKIQFHCLSCQHATRSPGISRPTCDHTTWPKELPYTLWHWSCGEAGCFCRDLHAQVHINLKFEKWIHCLTYCLGFNKTYKWMVQDLFQ